MNHFVFFSIVLLFNSYFIFHYLIRNLFINMKFLEIFYIELVLFFCYLFLLFLFKYFLFNKERIRVLDFGILLSICVFSFFIAYHNFKDYKIKIYKVLSNKMISGYFEFQISKVKSNYVLLKVIKSYDNYYSYLINTNVIIQRNKLDRFIGNELVGSFLLEDKKFLAFAYLEFVNQYEKKFDFYFSNNIFYGVNYFYDINFVNDDNFINKFINNVRGYINKRYSDFGKYSDILKGMIWGVDDFSYYEKQKLIKSGLYHLFVASGGNIALVLNFSFYLLSFLYYLVFRDIKNRGVIIFFSIIIVWIYCLVVGFDYPLLRAFIIAIITNLVLFNYDQKSNIFYLVKLFFVLLIVFLFIDYKFIYNLSFKMSFISFIGIVVLGDTLKKWIIDFFDRYPYFLRIIFYYVVDSFVMSLSATIFLLPILIYYFGFLSISGIFYNIFVSVIYPVVFYLGIIYLFFKFNVIYYIIYFLLGFIDYIVNQKQLVLYFK